MTTTERTTTDGNVRRAALAAALAAALFVAACPSHRSGGPTDPSRDPDGEGYYRDSAGPRRTRTTAPDEDEDEGARDAAASEPPVLVRRAPSTSGPLDGDAAGLVIFEAEAELRRCYAEARGDAAGRGVVYVLLDVEPAGRVGGVLVGHSDVRDLEFLECLDEVLADLAMPEAAAESVVQAHLVFGARDEVEGRRMLHAYRAARAAASAESDQPVPLTEVRQSVQGCYERVFRGRGSEGGRLVLQLALHEDGRVASVEITEDSLEGRLDDCVVDVVGKLRLELAEDASTTISYPVIIQPSREPEEIGEPATDEGGAEEPAEDDAGEAPADAG